MGGAIRRIFSPPKYTPPPAQVVTAPAASGARKKLNVGEGSGVTGTIMTDATGIEEEANVSKTVLGGTTTKKKKKYA